MREAVVGYLLGAVVFALGLFVGLNARGKCDCGLDEIGSQPAPAPVVEYLPCPPCQCRPDPDFGISEVPPVPTCCVHGLALDQPCDACKATAPPPVEPQDPQVVSEHEPSPCPLIRPRFRRGPPLGCQCIPSA